MCALNLEPGCRITNDYVYIESELPGSGIAFSYKRQLRFKMCFSLIFQHFQEMPQMQGVDCSCSHQGWRPLLQVHIFSSIYCICIK